nr:hypothetical protein [Paraflavitalea speifideiaquila]
MIKATAINHGGRTNGYTVPNPQAQASVISKACKRAGIDPRTISYLEAHGTGTSLGDPIEITGLKKPGRHLRKTNISAPSDRSSPILAIVKVRLAWRASQKYCCS